MEWLVIFFTFLFGLIIGSFLNVVIYRYNTGQPITGRSYCFACRMDLSWYDLLPLFSFIYNRGRCRSCRSLISLQYPLVEFFTASVFALLAWNYRLADFSFSGTTLIIFYYIIVSILVVIAVYDLRHKIIPDDFVFAFIALSFFSPFVVYLSLSISAFTLLANGLLAMVVIGGLFWGLWRYSDGRWMGFGDVKLVLGIGLLLGLSKGVTAIIVAFWLGAIVGLLLILAKNFGLLKRFPRLSLKSELPFAPFLVLATLLGLIFEFNLLPF